MSKYKVGDVVKIMLGMTGVITRILPAGTIEIEEDYYEDARYFLLYDNGLTGSCYENYIIEKTGRTVDMQKVFNQMHSGL